MERTMLLFVAAVAVGCSSSTSKDNGEAPDTSYILKEEPPGALSVKEAKARVKDGDEVTLVGRIGGSEKPWVDGRASFHVVDLSFKACSDIEGDSCPTPWDYCCVDADELKQGMAGVKFVDADGATLRTDARKLL